MFAIGPKQHLDKKDVVNDDSTTTVKVFSIGPNGRLDKTEGRTYLDDEDLGEYDDKGG